ncbi:hypothetical protein FRB94_005318 [Tulasnella sp. JGI-2019a]|nr:hypothetical protein FRB94_005318 [Tulasnella sp. JGI-2019a]
MKTTPAAVSLVCIASLVAARNFTVTNNCAYTIWPALYTDLNVGTATPSQPTGWEQAAAATVSFAVPDNWTSGRIWVNLFALLEGGARLILARDPGLIGPS